MSNDKLMQETGKAVTKILNTLTTPATEGIQLNDLEKAFMQKLQSDPDALLLFMIDYKEKVNDLGIVKNVALEVMHKLGLVNNQGTMREKISVRDITGTMFKMFGNMGKFEQDFAFLSALKPIIEKYKDL